MELSNKRMDFVAIKSIFIAFIIIWIVGFILYIISSIILNKLRIKKIKKKYEKRRFKYVDTFYYMVSRTNGFTHCYWYHIIEDCETKKLYGIFGKNTQSKVQPTGAGSIVYGGKLWQIIDYLDEGNFWIKEELPDYYKRNDQEIILDYDKKFCYYDKNGGKIKYSINKKPTLSNNNKNYDITLLDKVTFIDGYMEFDEK